MKKSLNKKLVLNRETIRELQDPDLRRVARSGLAESACIR